MTPIPADQLLAPTLPDGTEVRPALDRMRAMAFRFVQLSATRPGLRPRDLDRSARRDLAATLRRLELRPAGLDAWIPPGHLLEAARADRAIAALLAAIDLAADLGRCPVSCTLPVPRDDDERTRLEPIVAALADRADLVGVPLADHARAADGAPDPRVALGVDPPACLAAGVDPVEAVAAAGARLAAARLCDLLTSGVRGPVGDPREGRLDVDGYRAALVTFAPRLPVVIDGRQWPEPWEGFARSADARRDAALA